MDEYTSITIIYNPKSTGDSKKLASELVAQLRDSGLNNNVSAVATKHRGHAESLAYELATTTRHPLIISASGDGGYNEVVNGVMRATQTGAHPVAGLLPAGNANDHYHAVHNKDVASAIIDQHEQHIDLLHVRATQDQKTVERYAHSYVGAGLTPKVGHELNKTKLSRIKETWIVCKTLLTLQPVRLTINGRTHSYDSLLCSNISTMAKVLRLSDNAHVRDGRFEVNAFRRKNRLTLIRKLLTATIKGLPGNHTADRFSFTTVKPTLLQLDGELITCDARTEVNITLAQHALCCIV